MNDETLLPIQDKEITSLSGQSIYSNDNTFQLAQRVANSLSKSKLVPSHFQENIPDCLIALQLALRLNVDPFALMQHMSIVKGKPCIEGKFYLAILNSRSRYDGGLNFYYSGEGAKRTITASAIVKDTGEKHELSLSLEEVHRIGWDSNSWWKNMPDQMLAYRAASLFAKRYCPELMLGLLTKDEALDTDTYRNNTRRVSNLNEKLRGKNE